MNDRNVECYKYQVGSHVAFLLDEQRCRLLLAGTSQNPDSPVLALIDECKRRGVPTIAFVDMAADADRRFKGRSTSPLEHQPDSLLVADRTTESAFQALGFSAVDLYICGHPAYDRVRQRSQWLAGCDRVELRRKVLGSEPGSRPVWLFVAEHGENDPRLIQSPDYTLFGRGHSNRRVDIVLEEVLDARASIDPRPFLVLRLHPKNSESEFAGLLPEVDMVSQGGDPIELVWISDLVVGMSSILLMEAAIAGRSTLSVIPREIEREWCPSVMEGLTPCVATRGQLRMMLSRKNVSTSVHFELGSVSRIVEVILQKLLISY